MSRSTYLTSRRISEVRSQLDDRDWSLMRDLRRVRVLTGLQVQQLFHGDGDAAKARRVRQLGRLSRLQVIRRLERRIGGVHAGSYSSVYALDVAGQRLVEITEGQHRRPWTPSSPFIRHALSVSQVYVELRLAERAGAVELLGFDTEPDCWQPYHDHGGRRQLLKPDASVVTAAGDYEHYSLVEVDLGTESLSRLRTKMRSYVDWFDTGGAVDIFGVVPVVVWASPLPDRAEQIEGVARSVFGRTRYTARVCRTDDLVGVLGGAEQ